MQGVCGERFTAVASTLTRIDCPFDFARVQRDDCSILRDTEKRPVRDQIAAIWHTLR
jgi:hypothetical protein